jgi:hypothetical protein
MAQRHYEGKAELAGEIDGTWIERLRHDPSVFVYHRTTDEPYVPALRVTEPVDLQWLLGRGCTDEEESALTARAD